MAYTLKQHILICFCLLMTFALISQNATAQTEFTLRGKVVNSGNNSPVRNVSVEIKSGDYTSTAIDGSFQL